MEDYKKYLDEDFIIYNSQLVLRAFVWIEKIEAKDEQTIAYLEEPYEMVYFDLDKLILKGKISFEACKVYTTKKWNEELKQIQKEAFINQRKNQKQYIIKPENKNQRKHRELLALPLEGILKQEQIKNAYRTLVKKVHPDVGGGHEKFIEVTFAKNELLKKLHVL